MQAVGQKPATVRQAPEQGPPAALVTAVAVASGALIANLYYAQPLIASIAPAIGVETALAGTVVGVTQIGYGIGLFLLVSLADLVENRALVLTLMGCVFAGLAAAALARSAAVFFAASLVIGVCSAAAQILLPFLSQLVPEDRRGRVLGNVMAGVLTGVMLARPVALFIAGPFGWRAVFCCSAVLMLGIGAALWRMMPRHRPRGGMHFGRMLASMAELMRDLPVLRHRAAYQALLFAAFNMFWTVSPLMLAERFGLGAEGIGLFALAGAGGALAAPFAGRLADRGLARVATGGAMLATAGAFLATAWAARSGALAALAVLAIVIDAAVQTNQVVSQRIIFSVAASIRGRVNALYMTSVFAGGATGSVLGAIVYHHAGWDAVAGLGGVTGVVALILLLLHERRARGAR
ncbi:MAG TPA: MFS transporter [Acetobacteraceae bacterium]|nr:MFS transporter [Acetobacteraceae bacterium]